MTENDPVVMLMLPALPVLPEPNWLPMRLSSARLIACVALSCISPACAPGKPNPSLIPTQSLLPWLKVKFLAVMARLPPPPPRASTIALLLRETSDRATASGKLKCQSPAVPLSPTIPCPATAPNSTRLPGLMICPPSNRTSPPTSNRLCPAGTCSPVPLFAVERLMIACAAS